MDLDRNLNRRLLQAIIRNSPGALQGLKRRQ